MRRLLACALLVAVACSAEPTVTDEPVRTRSSHQPKPRASRPAKTPSKPAEMLVYIKNGTLHGFDLEDGSDVVLRDVNAADVVLSPDGERIAVVTDHDPGGDPEGFADPYIGIAEVAGDSPVAELGPGYSPRWSPDGASLAALTDSGVITYDLSTGAPAEVLSGEGWTIAGWSGGRVAALGQGRTMLAGTDASTDLGFEPQVVWGVSPVDGTVLSVGGDTPELVGPDTTVPVGASGGLGDGAWAPDGSRIVGVLIGRGPSRAIAIDTATGQVADVPEGNGAQGNVVWSHDSESFAFVRVDPGDKLDLQAVVCHIQEGCEPAFSWGQGVLLLGFARV